MKKRQFVVEADADITLRPYQQEAIQSIVNEWKTLRSIMLQMPTGTGKTRLFVSLINTLAGAAKEISSSIGENTGAGLQFLIVTHREELVEQISDTLNEHYHLQHGIFQGKSKSGLELPIIVASIQSLATELKNGAKGIRFRTPDYIIIDEAHHSLADSYATLLKHYPKAYKLGVTATPYRLRRSSFKPLFQTLILSLSIERFIQQGYLSDYCYYTASAAQAALQRVNRLTKFNPAGDYQTKDLQEIYATERETDFLYQCYKQYAHGRRGIIYAVNRLHAEMIARLFTVQGVQAEAIDSKTAAKKRKQLIGQFRNGELQVLVNVELFGEGFDCPDIEFAMLARPTRSLAMYLQQVGRALRPTPNGKPAVILDCVGLYNRFGLPERERNWTAHFNGWKNDKENYNRPLGLNTDNESSMTDVSPIRSNSRPLGETNANYDVFYDQAISKYGIRRQGLAHVKATFKQLVKTKDGWFYGKTDENALVILDCNANPVFRMRRSEIKLNDDGGFSIIVTSPDRKRYTIGPFTSKMSIPAEHLQPMQLSYMGFDSTMLYRIIESGVFLTSYRLSLGNKFYRKAFPVTGTSEYEGGIAFIDLDNKIYKRSRFGDIWPWGLPEAQIRQYLKDERYTNATSLKA